MSNVASLPEPTTERSPAFEAEALDYFGTLRRLSLRLGCDPAEAEDLVQDVYTRALGASHRFVPGTNLRAWLGTILRNLVSNHRRDRRRARVRIDEEAVARAADRERSTGRSPEQAILASEITPRLRAALESMPKALRDAVWLRDVEELSYAEIAARLRIPLGTVMSRISRGRRLLHARVLMLDSPAPER